MVEVKYRLEKGNGDEWFIIRNYDDEPMSVYYVEKKANIALSECNGIPLECEKCNRMVDSISITDELYICWSCFKKTDGYQLGLTTGQKKENG